MGENMIIHVFILFANSFKVIFYGAAGNQFA